MATWKRILVDGDVTGISPIEVTGDTPTISLELPAATNDGADSEDEMLIYDVSASEWNKISLEGVFNSLTAALAQIQINGGGASTVFAPGGVLGDLDGDGTVSVNDMLLFFGVYGTAGDSAALYQYADAALGWSTFSLASLSDSMNVSSAGTATSQLITISVNTTTDIITFDDIPQTSNASQQNLSITIVPEVFSVGLAAFSINVIVKTYNGSTLINTYEPQTDNILVQSSSLYGLEFESNPVTVTIPALNFLEADQTAVEKFTVEFETNLVTSNDVIPTINTHKIRIKDLTINYA
jgi:hypothetical protein